MDLKKGGLLVLILFYLVSGFSQNKTSVWVDTDIAFGKFGRDVDDGLALITCLNTKHLNIVGISTVRFPNRAYRKSKKILKWYTSDSIPVYKGAKSNENKLTEGAKAIIEACNNADSSLTILALGPLTNIAQAIKQAPKIENKIKEIVFCGGRTKGEPINPGGKDLKMRDVNFEEDTASFRVVFNTDIPLVLSGFESSKDLWLYKEDLAFLNESKVKHHRKIYGELKEWLFIWKHLFKIEGFNPFDVATVGYLTDRDNCNCEERNAFIHERLDEVKKKDDKLYLETTSDEGNGRSVIYCKPVSEEFKKEFLRKLKL